MARSVRMADTGTEWIGTNTINGSQITGDGRYLGYGPYGTRPPVCLGAHSFELARV